MRAVNRRQYPSVADRLRWCLDAAAPAAPLPRALSCAGGTITAAIVELPSMVLMVPDTASDHNDEDDVDRQSAASAAERSVAADTAIAPPPSLV